MTRWYLRLSSPLSILYFRHGGDRLDLAIPDDIRVSNQGIELSALHSVWPDAQAKVRTRHFDIISICRYHPGDGCVLIQERELQVISALCRPSSPVVRHYALYRLGVRNVSAKGSSLLSRIFVFSSLHSHPYVMCFDAEHLAGGFPATYIRLPIYSSLVAYLDRVGGCMS